MESCTSECSICLNPITTPEPNFYECSHKFHAHCSTKWDVTKDSKHEMPTCPVCRAATKNKISMSITNEDKTITVVITNKTDLCICYYDKDVPLEIRTLSALLFGDAKTTSTPQMLYYKIENSVAALFNLCTEIFGSNAIFVYCYYYIQNLKIVQSSYIRLLEKPHKLILEFCLLNFTSVTDVTIDHAYSLKFCVDTDQLDQQIERGEIEEGHIAILNCIRSSARRILE